MKELNWLKPSGLIEHRLSIAAFAAHKMTGDGGTPFQPNSPLTEHALGLENYVLDQMAATIILYLSIRNIADMSDIGQDTDGSL